MLMESQKVVHRKSHERPHTKLKRSTMTPSKSEVYKRIRVIYVKTDFFESLMQKALGKYGFRMTLAKTLGYSSPNALKQNTEEKGILARRFLKLCEIAGVEIKEVEPHIVAVVFYGNRKRAKFSERDYARAKEDVRKRS